MRAPWSDVVHTFHVEDQGVSWKAAAVTGVGADGAEDLPVLLSNLATSLLAVAGCAVLFSPLRRNFPSLYRGSELSGATSLRLPESLFGWLQAWNVKPEEAQESAGLDGAMLLEFCDLSARLLLALGAPLLCLLGPANVLAGWGPAGAGAAASPTGLLNRLGVLGVPPGARLSWAHAAAVWFVVVVSERMIFQAQRAFLPRRFAWLRAMPPPRATTVLVEALPRAQRSDRELERYFASMFSQDVIASAYVVKKTATLAALLEQQQGLEGDDVDEAVEEQREALAASVKEERQRLAEACERGDEEAHASSGFVTFRRQREAALALLVRYKPAKGQMVTRLPPEPSDVNYADLSTDRGEMAISEFTGHCSMALLFLLVMPVSFATMKLTSLRSLRSFVPFVNVLIEQWPVVRAFFERVLPVLLVQFIIGNVPALMMMIFRRFHCTVGHAWAQRSLQAYYYWFLVLFVLLATVVDISLVRTIEKVVDGPVVVIWMLAESMPLATHFYLNFMLLQCVTHAMNLTRYMPLAKYLLLRAAVGEARAVELSEPDQDYFGMGARSARWSLDLVLALVFCSVSPLITAVALVNFLLCRVFYGYLTVFAETRRHDLGGPFFVEKMKQVQFGLLLYVLLMIGIFLRRARSWFPVVVAGLALLPVAYCFKRFSAMAWEFLPFDWVISERFLQRTGQEMAKYQAAGDRRLRYTQPELSEENWGTHAR
mmetsp:Transcript_56873/g.182776  ORF Transcript_56873/g.182776 Transcript_56873/m.182776 type:complete len:714 (-) Transcript_56873:17-2158(-)